MLEKLETLRQASLIPRITDMDKLRAKHDSLSKNGKLTELLKAIPTLQLNSDVLWHRRERNQDHAHGKTGKPGRGIY